MPSSVHVGTVASQPIRTSRIPFRIFYNENISQRRHA